MLNIGDTIKCADQENMLNMMRTLRQEGYEFRQTAEPHKLVITGVGESNWVEDEE